MISLFGLVFFSVFSLLQGAFLVILELRLDWPLVLTGTAAGGADDALLVASLDTKTAEKQIE